MVKEKLKWFGWMQKIDNNFLFHKIAWKRILSFSLQNITAKSTLKTLKSK